MHSIIPRPAHRSSGSLPESLKTRVLLKWPLLKLLADDEGKNLGVKAPLGPRTRVPAGAKKRCPRRRAQLQSARPPGPRVPAELLPRGRPLRGPPPDSRAPLTCTRAGIWQGPRCRHPVLTRKKPSWAGRKSNPAIFIAVRVPQRPRDGSAGPQGAGAGRRNTRTRALPAHGSGPSAVAPPRPRALLGGAVPSGCLRPCALLPASPAQATAVSLPPGSRESGSTR